MRAMAQDMVRVMERLGFERYSVAGHGRGELALYRPDRVDRLTVLDVQKPGTWHIAGTSEQSIYLTASCERGGDDSGREDTPLFTRVPRETVWKLRPGSIVWSYELAKRDERPPFRRP